MKHRIMKVAAVVAACGCGLNVSVQGSGKVVSEERTLPAFVQVLNATTANVTVHVGAAPRVLITIDDNLMQYVETTINGNTLEVRTRKLSTFNPTKFEVEVYTQTLTGVSVKGSGDMQVVDEVRAESFEASLSGSGNMKCRKVACSADLSVSIAGSGNIEMTATAAAMDISLKGSGDFTCSDCTAQRISAAIAGSSDIKLHGKTTELQASIAGSGDIDAAGMEAARAAASIAGSGDIKVWAVETLKVNISGSGDIAYKGSPQMDVRMTGSGKMRRLD